MRETILVLGETRYGRNSLYPFKLNCEYIPRASKAATYELANNNELLTRLHWFSAACPSSASRRLSRLETAEIVAMLSPIPDTESCIRSSSCNSKASVNCRNIYFTPVYLCVCFYRSC